MTKNARYLSALTLGHFANDLYPGMLSPLLPIFLDRFGWSLAQAGLLVAILQFFSNFTQPVFAIIEDHRPTRAFLWLGVLVSAAPFVWIMSFDTFWLMAVAMAVTGTGAGMFHPAATVAAGKNTVRNQGGVSMAFFTAGGQVSFMIAPLIAILIFEVIGEWSMPLLVVPGIVVAALLFRNGASEQGVLQKHSFDDWWSAIREGGSQLFGLWVVATSRSVVQLLIGSFLPMLAMARGATYAESAYILVASLFAGMVGMFFGGHLADVLGARKVMALSLFIAAPLLAAFLFTTGWLSIVFLLAGMAVLNSTIPTNIILAQKVHPRLAGIASSLVMGLSFGVGALAAAPFGALADRIGIEQAMMVPVVLTALGGFTVVLVRHD